MHYNVSLDNFSREEFDDFSQEFHCCWPGRSELSGGAKRWCWIMWVQQINQFNTQRSRLFLLHSVVRYEYIFVSSPLYLSPHVRLSSWQVACFQFQPSMPVNWRLLLTQFVLRCRVRELEVQTLDCVSNGIVAPPFSYPPPPPPPEELCLCTQFT